jgi:hypothetical protein
MKSISAIATGLDTRPAHSFFSGYIDILMFLR